MRLDFGRTTVVFIIFLIIIAAIFGVSRFIQSQPPLEIDIVVDPIAEDWMKAAALAYNAGEKVVGTTKVQVNIEVIDDLDVWRSTIGWNSQNHPHGWIPSTSLSLELVPSSLPFDTVNNSAGYTPLVWGGFASRVDVITENGTQAFDWTQVQAIASNTRWDDNSFVNMAITWPTGSMAGVGALGTAAADFHQKTTLSAADLSDAEFTAWFAALKDSLLNAERLGDNPAGTMATRGTSAADFALLPEALWLNQVGALLANGNFVFSYPAYQFSLDFPVTVWDDPQTTDDERAAVASFASFLAGEGQSIALDHGFRPASGAVPQTASLFIRAAPSGIVLEPDMTNTITLSGRSLAEQLISLVD